MKPRYEKPFVVRHGVTAWGKGGAFAVPRSLASFDGLAVEDLLERYGSPLFVLSERRIRERVRELSAELGRRFASFTIAWSYKTNYLDAICKVMHREGSLAEVVSEMELDKALRHVPGTEVIFNGPYKPEAALEKAFRAGARVHLDHFDELARAEVVARRLELRPRVAIRINMALPGTPPWSRFGFNLESGQALDAVRRILAGGVLQLAGLHAHIGTFVQDVDAYRQEARKLAELANGLARDHGVLVEWIDLGGGFASRNTLHAQYLPGEEVTPSFAQYAEAIAEGLAALALPGGKEPVIFLETGRALVDEAGSLITTVHANKRLADGRRAVVLDAGVNSLFTAFWYRHDVVPAQEFAGTPEPTVLYGPLCMAIDVVRDQLLFPPLTPGDRIVVRNVGAYNVTQWMQFITERPAVVMISRRGESGLIRRRESVETLLAQEEVPGWLG